MPWQCQGLARINEAERREDEAQAEYDARIACEQRIFDRLCTGEDAEDAIADACDTLTPALLALHRAHTQKHGLQAIADAVQAVVLATDDALNWHAESLVDHELEEEREWERRNAF